MTGPAPENETYLQRVGRLGAARSAATEIWAADHPQPDPTTPPAPPARTDPAWSEVADLEVTDQDVPEPPELPADPSHPLNRPDLVEQMSTEEYRTALQQWQQSEEYQRPARLAAAYRRRLRDS